MAAAPTFLERLGDSYDLARTIQLRSRFHAFTRAIRAEVRWWAP